MSNQYTERQKEILFEKSVDQQQAAQLIYMNDQIYFERRSYIILLSVIGFGLFSLFEVYKIFIEKLILLNKPLLLTSSLSFIISIVLVIIAHEIAKETRVSKAERFSVYNAKWSEDNRKRAGKYMKKETYLKIFSYALTLIGYITLIWQLFSLPN